MGADINFKIRESVELLQDFSLLFLWKCVLGRWGNTSVKGYAMFCRNRDQIIQQ